MPAEETSLVTSAELGITLERLKAFIGTVSAAKDMVDNGTGKLAKGLYTFRKPSLRFAMDRIESFERELIKAMEAHELGIPYDANTPKNRRERDQSVQTQKVRVTRPRTRSRK